MDDLLKDMDSDPASRAQFEQLLFGMEQSTGGTPATASTKKNPKATTKTTNKKPANFQDTINKTMERLKESGQEIDQEMANDDGETDDFLSEMLKQLGSAAGEAGGIDDDGFDMSNLVTEMMEQLSSKEVLYEPMLEMHEKYPAWLLKNSSKCTPEQLKNYKEQQQITAEIVQRFQSPRYSDSNKDDKAFIAERMERMQATGSPPAELMGDLADGGIPGLDMGEDGLPKLPEDLEGCPTQ
ncbi:Pex19 protein [Nadsonia fulvescens var. elongata DSM 6958]|uniref:Pex19 protein n=1 Tax=Nadsonia fulvescens var. elongata DSM 6958 TaxID=857566 RepID=A0A1E3PF26_9ASCO|nr:Pex19 protein [Nadsonia fulvescens var. elongata DSM 6958]